ncbi:MAG: ribonuclease P protein component [Actinobacteria bacterium]|nr:ribonuclease P protein component [Actinomycetota bacterium]
MPESPMESLKKSRDFRRVIERGNRETMQTITTYRLPNQTGQTRTGISVTRKTGGSVKRNLIKRRIREAIRKNAAGLPAGEDIVFVARRGIDRASYGEIERDIRKTAAESRD